MKIQIYSDLHNEFALFTPPAGDMHDGHLSAAYTNRWNSLLAKVDVWIFGHTHRAIDIELGGSRLISNPRGYPQEFTGFISDFTMEI